VWFEASGRERGNDDGSRDQRFDVGTSPCTLLCKCVRSSSSISGARRTPGTLNIDDTEPHTTSHHMPKKKIYGMRSDTTAFTPSDFWAYEGCTRRTAFGWRHGSVVRTSVFGRRTFPDLRLICGWHVTSSWVTCPLWVNQPADSAFHPSGVGKWEAIHVITWMTWLATI